MKELNCSKIADIIKTLATEMSYEGITYELNEDTDLIESGIIDSLMMVELVTKLEEMYEIDMEVDELVPDNFRTIIKIRDMISRAMKTK